MAVARTLHIQVQPGLAESLDMVRLRREFQAIATDNPLVSGHRFRNGNDDGDYYNFDFDTPRPAALWEQIRAAVYDASAFGQSVHHSSMAICTGIHGWEDYLLIHHWDPAEDLDDVPAI
jgi:hypothetical protein